MVCPDLFSLEKKKIECRLLQTVLCALSVDNRVLFFNSTFLYISFIYFKGHRVTLKVLVEIVTNILN